MTCISWTSQRHTVCRTRRQPRHKLPPWPCTLIAVHCRLGLWEFGIWMVTYSSRGFPGRGFVLVKVFHWTYDSCLAMCYPSSAWYEGQLQNQILFPVWTSKMSGQLLALHHQLLVEPICLHQESIVGLLWKLLDIVFHSPHLRGRSLTKLKKISPERGNVCCGWRNWVLGKNELLPAHSKSILTEKLFVSFPSLKRKDVLETSLKRALIQVVSKTCCFCLVLGSIRISPDWSCLWVSEASSVHQMHLCQSLSNSSNA